MKRYDWVGWAPFYLLAVILCIGTAMLGSKTVTTLVQNEPVKRQHTIIVDAGHGGIDGGATSCTGVLEKQINLQIALRLDDLLHLLGFDTVMIRTTDTSVYTQGNTIAAQKVSDLNERVRTVNETENAILLSIHQNTYPDSRYSGAVVFYAGTDGSMELAQILQNNLISCLNPGSRRQCKKADSVYLLQNVQRCAILIECGFLSNPEEEAKLRSSTYQQKLCCVITSSLTEFLEKNS